MKYEIVAIGVSYGGLEALEIILSELPKNFSMAIAIAQHRHKSSDGELIDFLQRCSRLPISEAQDKQAIVSGQAYLAPSDYHLMVDFRHFALSTEAPVISARPSIDVLFESIADAYNEQAIGVILTGSSEDGAKGLAKIRAYGGLAIVQDPATAMSRIMPDAAIAVVPDAKILTLTEIASFLIGTSERRQKAGGRGGVGAEVIPHKERRWQKETDRGK